MSIESPSLFPEPERGFPQAEVEFGDGCDPEEIISALASWREDWQDKVLTLATVSPSATIDTESFSSNELASEARGGSLKGFGECLLIALAITPLAREVLDPSLSSEVTMVASTTITTLGVITVQAVRHGVITGRRSPQDS